MPSQEHPRHFLHADAEGLEFTGQVASFYSGKARDADGFGLDREDDFQTEVSDALADHDALPDSVRTAVEAALLQRWSEDVAEVAPDAPRDATTQ